MEIEMREEFYRNVKVALMYFYYFIFTIVTAQFSHLTCLL